MSVDHDAVAKIFFSLFFLLQDSSDAVVDDNEQHQETN